MQQFHTTNAVGVYLAVLTVIAAAATFLLRDRTGIPLDPDARGGAGPRRDDPLPLIARGGESRPRDRRDLDSGRPVSVP